MDLRRSLLLAVFFIGPMSACSPVKKTKTLDSNLQLNGILNGVEVRDLDETAAATVVIYEETEGQLCTGVLIQKNLVLTAAHCVATYPESVFIAFVQNFRGDVPPEKYRKAIGVEVYKGWSAQSLKEKNLGDIALIKFAGPLSEPYKPISMIPIYLVNTLKIETKVDVLGFGVTTPTDINTAGVLYKAQLPIENPQFASTEIALNQTVGSSICHGDSGGPAFIRIKNQNFVFGIASRGLNDKKGECNTQAIYTKLWMYSAWIKQATARLEKFSK